MRVLNSRLLSKGGITDARELRFQHVYRTLRELAMSYFDTYFNLRRERTLRTFSVPFNLKYFDARVWMTTDEPVWFVAEHLFEIRHFPLLRKGQEKHIRRVNDRLFRAGCVDRALKSANR